MPPESSTIGRVLETLKGEFPDISVSKLRYLETEGLVSPDRQQPSGYRRYSQQDIERLRYVLRAQRDRYLPLKVIREELEAIDRGEDPETFTAQPEKPVVKRRESPKARAKTPPKQLMTRRQVLEASGLGEASFIHLERLKLIRTRRGTQLYGREVVTIAECARRLSHYGVDLRQLKVVQQAASSEAALVEQILEPYRRLNGTPAETMNDVYKTVIQAHLALLYGEIYG